MAHIKHREVIQAWLEGQLIQFMDYGGRWMDCDRNGADFFPDIEYRVKPAEPERTYPATQMNCGELYTAYKRGRSDGDVIWNSEGCAAVANAALRHACDAGQIVTRAEFDRAVGDRKARDMAVAEAVRTWAWDRAAGPYEGTRPNYDWAVQYRQAIVFADLAPIIAGVEA